MPPVAHLILLVFAFVCFAMAAWAAPSPDPWYRRLIALGLASGTLSMLQF